MGEAEGGSYVEAGAGGVLPWLYEWYQTPSPYIANCSFLLEIWPA